MKRGIVDRLMGILEETGLDPESLRLEVTENVVLEHVDIALENLNQLRAMGIQLSIDDFGSGGEANSKSLGGASNATGKPNSSTSSSGAETGGAGGGES